jgi:predicted lipid-binding transport protein (Tim44 family)
MLTNFLIAFLASLALVVKDWLETKDLAKVKTNWKRYVGCLVAGLLYGLLSDLSFFRWIAIVGVIYLFANSFANVLTFLNWFIRALGFKKASL